MTTPIVVIYTYNLRSGITAQQLLEASAALDAHVKSMAGFQYRSLSQTTTPDHPTVWQDINYWESEAAYSKTDDMMDHPVFQTLMALIEMESVKIVKANVCSSLLAEMEPA